MESPEVLEEVDLLLAELSTGPSNPSSATRLVSYGPGRAALPRLVSLSPDIDPSLISICFMCTQGINGSSVFIPASDRSYHTEHFNCVYCGKNVADSRFCEVDEGPLCLYCYGVLADHKSSHRKLKIDEKPPPKYCTLENCLQYEILAGVHRSIPMPSTGAPPKRPPMHLCFLCNGPLNRKDGFVSAMGRRYHREHFTCEACQRRLDGSTYYSVGDNALCQGCYDNNSLSICATCKKVIKGATVAAHKLKWHPEHFACSYCGLPLSANSETKLFEGNLICNHCYAKLPSAVRRRLRAERKARQAAKVQPKSQANGEPDNLLY